MSLFTAKELSKYSLTKAIAEISDQRGPGEPGQLSGLELEISDALKTHYKRTHDGTSIMEDMIPLGALAPIGKAINATTATSGGFLVAETLDTVAPALRSASVVLALGANLLTNLKGSLGLPSENSFQSASWLSESESLPDAGDQAFSKTVLSPKRCATLATLSKQLLAQNSLGVENFVRASLRATLGTALDSAALHGNGLEEPLGLLNNPNCGQVTFGATATRAKVISFQDTLAAANVGNTPEAALGYVTDPTTASKWLQIQESSGTSFYLWRGSEWEGTVCGLPARATANIGSSHAVICGDWSKLNIGLWSEGFSILADGFARKKEGFLELYCHVLADCAPTFASAFVVSTDSGAQ